MKKRKIVIAGGTGALGSALIMHFNNGLNDLVILTRKNRKDQNNVRYVQWDTQSLENWTDEFEGTDLLINLAGKSINCRCTEENKKEIIRSRVVSTTIIGRAIQQCKSPPKVWINAGGIAIFGNSNDEIKDENSKEGEGFFAEVCKEWEKAFKSMELPYTRKVFLRIGLVLQKNNGILKPFINLVKLGLGGKLGSGEQYITWIHEKDFVRLTEWVATNDDISGVIHAVSPFPVKNKEFMRVLRKVTGYSFGIPAPAISVKIGAFFIRTEAELVLSGRKVVSRLLDDSGFSFQYPQLEGAVQNLIQKKKNLIVQNVINEN